MIIYYAWKNSETGDYYPRKGICFSDELCYARLYKTKESAIKNKNDRYDTLIEIHMEEKIIKQEE